MGTDRVWCERGRVIAEARPGSKWGWFGGGLCERDGRCVGGTFTIEDSTFSSSLVSGLVFQSGTSATILRSKSEANGFAGGSLHGNGLYAFDARVVVEDSAFWSNATDGVRIDVGPSYALSPSEISGSSLVGNKRYGVFIFQGSTGVASLGADGHVAGKPGNAVYDNGTFGFSPTEFWHQLEITFPSLGMDWSGTYWGPVSVLPCALGSQSGQLSYGAPDSSVSNPNVIPVPRGPVPHDTATSGTFPNHTWCADDDVVVDPPGVTQPDLYFDAAPPTFGGLLIGQTNGCGECDLDSLGIASSSDQSDRDAQHYTGKPVNTASGSLLETAIDLQLAGPGIPFAWTRTYNSQDTTAGALGTGWTHAFAARITVFNPTTGELEYVSGSGQRTRFQRATGSGSGAATYGGKGFDGTMKRLSNNSYQLTTRDQRLFSFDSSGNLTQLKPRFRAATTLAYSSGKLSSITDSAGRTVAISYSGATPTLIDRVTLPDGRYVEYGYTSGKLTSVRDARGKTSTIAYDGNARLVSIRDPLNVYQLQNVQYDGQGRVTSEENGAADAITYAYTTSGGYDLTTVTIPGRGSWVYKHRAYMLFSVIDPLNRVTSFSYDSMGRKATSTDGRGNITRFEYDAYGNVVKEIAPQPLGYTTARTFNVTNDLLSETDGRGNTTSHVYATSSDAAADYQVGQLKTVTDRENGATTLKHWTSTSSPTPPATNVGLLKSVTDQRSKTSGYEYDSAGNLTTLTSPLGLKTTFHHQFVDEASSRSGATAPK